MPAPADSPSSTEPLNRETANMDTDMGIDLDLDTDEDMDAEVGTAPALPSLSQAFAVGQGFNVYGAFDSSSLTRPLADPQKAGTATFRFQGVDYSVPDFVIGVENTSSYVLKTVSDTREQAQEGIAVHAGVGGSYGAFSGEISTD